MGMIQEVRIGEGVSLVRLPLPDHSRNEPSDRFDHDQSRHLATREHVVPDRDLFGREPFDDPLVDPLVPAAKHGQVLFAGEFPHISLVESPTGRRQQQHAAPIRVEGLDRGEDRLGLHHHPWPAAEGRVVDRAMTVVGPLAKIMHADIQESLADRPSEETLAER